MAPAAIEGLHIRRQSVAARGSPTSGGACRSRALVHRTPLIAPPPPPNSGGGLSKPVNRSPTHAEDAGPSGLPGSEPDTTGHLRSATLAGVGN